jgi:hypothetical protein
MAAMVRSFAKAWLAAVKARTQMRMWWRGLDSNQRRRAPADLQSAPFSHSGTPPCAVSSVIIARLSTRKQVTKLVLFRLHARFTMKTLLVVNKQHAG